MYTRSGKYDNFFKLRSPFSRSIEALFVLPRGTVGFGFKKNCGEILNQCPESPVFNLLKISLQGIFENFYEDKNKNTRQNSSIHALGVNIDQGVIS